MFEGRVAVYFRDMSFKVDRKSEEQVRVVVAAFNIQPFTKKLAEQIWPPMARRLWRADDGERHTDMPSVTFTPSVPPQRVKWFPTPAPQEDVVAMEFRNVTFGPNISVHSDKETPDYRAGFTLTFAYPTAEHLLRLAHSINTQWWLEFDNEQEGLLNDEPGQPRVVKGSNQPELAEVGDE